MKRLNLLISWLAPIALAASVAAQSVPLDFSTVVTPADITLPNAYAMGNVILSYDNFGSGLGSAQVNQAGISGTTYGSLIFNFSGPMTTLNFDFTLENVAGPIEDAVALTFKLAGNDSADAEVATANYTPYDPAHPENGGRTTGSVHFTGSAFDQAILFFSPDAGSFTLGTASYSDGSQPGLTNVVLAPVNPFVAISNTAALHAVGQYDDGAILELPAANVVWTSSDPAVASIDAAGVVTGLTLGTTTVSADAAGVIGSTLLTVLATGPEIVTQPQSATVGVNGSVTLSVTATGDSLSYQWQFENQNLAGATNTSLALNNLTAEQAGAYVVVVTSPVGSVRSAEAIVSLLGLHMYAGLTLAGEAGETYKIEFQTSLTNETWITLTNLNLPTSPYLFIDLSSPGASQRFYRATLVP